MNAASETYPTQAQTGTMANWSLGAITGGSVAETVGGIAAVVLTILALLKVIPVELTAIAAIVVGAALFCEGGTIASAYRRALFRGGQSQTTAEIGGGITVEFLAGLAGLVLGILALFLNVGATLLAAAVIVLGAAMLVSSRLPTGRDEAAATPANGQAMIGLAAVILGILAFGSASSIVLIEVALLCLGVGVLMTGSFHGLARG
jgi:hypothetical protein